jgi:CO/xanthine dehydrogenase FAD-binding subunit
LFRNDGIEYLAKRADEILTEVLLEPADGWRSAYWKLRRRGSFDFPVLGVAAAARFASDGRTVEQARVVLGAVSSMPQTSVDAAELLVGHELTDARIERAAQAAGKVAKPMDNTDFTLHWRKRVAGEMVSWALRELRGDDVRAARVRYARHDPGAAIEG